MIMNMNRLLCLLISLLAISFITTINLEADDKIDKDKGVGPYAEHWKPIPMHKDIGLQVTFIPHLLTRRVNMVEKTAYSVIKQSILSL